jgi:uncharacterized RDD family membrane protein YckC
MIKPAGLFSRASAFVIDFVAVVALGGALAQRIGGPVGVVLGVALIPAYFLLFWSGSTQTLGNRLFRIALIGTDGRQIGMQRAAVRFVTLFAGAVPFFIGFTSAFANEGRQAWHDRAAATYVIESPFRNRGISETWRLSTGAEDWRPNPFVVAPQKRWPLAATVFVPILLGLATWFFVLPFLRLVASV